MVNGNVQRIAHSKRNSQSEEWEHQKLLKRKVPTNLDVIFTMWMQIWAKRSFSSNTNLLYREFRNYPTIEYDSAH